MASNREQAIDVYLLDLSATLRDSERLAETIVRRLSPVKHPWPAPFGPPDHAQVAAVLAASATLVEESRKLIENVRAGRELLRQVQAECMKLGGGSWRR